MATEHHPALAKVPSALCKVIFQLMFGKALLSPAFPSQPLFLRVPIVRKARASTFGREDVPRSIQFGHSSAASFGMP